VRTGPIEEAALVMRARALGAVLRQHGHLAGGAGAPTGGSVDVLLLHGPMGAGKTTFTRALAIGLGVTHPGRVCSPTFTLCMVHSAPGPRTLVHVDLFRLADADDDGMGGAAGFDALGGPGAIDLEEITEDALQLVGDPGHRVLVVEWAAKWSTPPADHLAIQLRLADGGARRILDVEARGPRSTAILAAWSAAFVADSPSFNKG
jgi:tRNA threonylcarbamoyl adenosine modification protein YjeE